MHLDLRQTLVVAILVLFTGQWMNRKIAILGDYNIPEPVSGGLAAAILFSLVYVFADVEVTFSLQTRDVLLVVFFTTIGLSARLEDLLKGGKPLAILCVFAALVLALQNVIGVAIAYFNGSMPVAGLLAGSISLAGGHGTAIAWADFFQTQYGINRAMEVGIAFATFGLVLGGLLGGPMAHFLIHRHRLQSEAVQPARVAFEPSRHEVIDVESVYQVLLLITVAAGLGISLNDLLEAIGINLPLFVPCLFAGILVSNVVPRVARNLPWPANSPTMELASSVSLGIFLAMSLMSVQLWLLFDLAILLLISAGIQAALVLAFTAFVVFPLLGKRYEAAVIGAGFVGLTLGATPTAVANMTAVTQKFGRAHIAFVVVPLVGAFFVDILNAIIINAFVRFVG